MAQDRWTLREKKQGARLPECSLWLMNPMQGTGNVAGCTNAVLGLPREMSAVNTNRCTGCQCSPVVRLPTGQSLQNSE